MAAGDRCCCYKCCAGACRHFGMLIKKSIPVIIVQVIGWALFSYIEDDLNIIDCVANPHKVANDMFPPSNEDQRALVLFEKLYNRTGLNLTSKQPDEVYELFRVYFNMPDYGIVISDTLKTYIGCLKWFRFASLTLTTIGFGVVTPKTNLGRILTIPYALASMPVVLSYLAFVGSLVSKLIEWMMMRVHKCIKGNKPLRYKCLKRCLYLFILFWCYNLVIVSFYAHQPLVLQSKGAMKWLDGLYFMFVTYTTVGFGDITGPAYDINFYMYWFFPGLAIASGLIDSLVSLFNVISLGSRAEGAVCCCITCNEEEGTVTSEEGTVTSEEVNDNTVQVVGTGRVNQEKID